MSEQLSKILKRTFDDLAAFGEMNAQTRYNTFKEELQFYVLNFIYHHPKYQSWIMYGGSALRIIHGLDRMSVDLDFEISHEMTEDYLEKLKKEIQDHFVQTYNAEINFLTIKITTARGLLLKFHLDEELSFGHSSKQVHVKIDLNRFIAPKTVTERRPITHDQLSFVIATYNMSSLMASKIAAIFLRGTRGVGKDLYEEKGRDIYDLLWYMNRKVVPDFDYLIAKGINTKNPRMLFDQLTIQMNKVSDKNLKQDLSPLFINQTFIGNWLKHWRENYRQLLKNYEIHTVKKLEFNSIHEDFNSGNFSFVYGYTTEDDGLVKITYIISNLWFDSSEAEGGLTIDVDKNLESKMEFHYERQKDHSAKQHRRKQYATLFNQKNEKYFEKTNHIMLGDQIVTKIIRIRSKDLNQKEQIVLNKSALLSCELDDLLK